MKSYRLSKITQAEVESQKARPRLDFFSIFGVVNPIVDDVHKRGDAAVKEYTSRFDKAEPDKIVLDPAIEEAISFSDIYAFDAAQKSAESSVENMKGVKCRRVARSINPGGMIPSTALMLLDPAQIAGCKTTVLTTPPAQDGDICKEVLYCAKKAGVTQILKAGGAQGIKRKRVARSINSVGLYVPGGTAVLPSTALMLSVPAQIAGCKTIVFTTPPAQDGDICKEVLYCAKKAGVTQILKAGGAQVIKNEDLEELKKLGSGTFGTVYHGKWRGTDVAIKRTKKRCFTGRSSDQKRLTVEFWQEADILSKLHHPNVVAFYGVVQDGPRGTLATVMEYMVDGSLRHVLLRKDRYLDRHKRLIIAMDAAFGMEYLHSKNIVHFDLKCDNLLVNLKDPLRPICKVGDFGLSKIKPNTLVSGGMRGTLPWMAPELLNSSINKVSEKVDVFSFGIVLWEIQTGEEPYANMHGGAIIDGVVNNTLRPTIPNYCDSEWRTLMEQCWAPSPAARPSFTEIASRLRTMSAAASQTKAGP